MKDFLRENKAAVIVILVALVVVAWSFYSSYQIVVKECKEICIYSARNNVWQYKGGLNVSRFKVILGGRDFPEQSQCIDYCLDQR